MVREEKQEKKKANRTSELRTAKDREQITIELSHRFEAVLGLVSSALPQCVTFRVRAILERDAVILDSLLQPANNSTVNANIIRE